MANIYKDKVFKILETQFGRLRNIGEGYSLYSIDSIDTIIYFRYSKITKSSKNVTKAFYGLRKDDIDLMIIQGKKCFIYLITDEEDKNILIPFNQFEEYFIFAEPAKDGQFKTATYFKPTGKEIYFANIGKFSIEGYIGLNAILQITTSKIIVPYLSHNQIQSLIGCIGIKKGFDVWFPNSDKNYIDYKIVDSNKSLSSLPFFNKEVGNIINEIDVIWLSQHKPVSFWEVEHSTPIYSGLLRFNDVLLTMSGSNNFNIVADEERENKFGREINRPTFKQNKLIDKVTFVNYKNIYNWYYTLTGENYEV